MEKKKGLLIGSFHIYTVCAHHSRTCSQCEVLVKTLARIGALGSEQSSLLPCSALTSPKLQTALSDLFPSRAIIMLLPISKHGENLPDCLQKRPQSLCVASTLLLSLLSFLFLNLLALQQKRALNILLAHFPLLTFPQS